VITSIFIGMRALPQCAAILRVPLTSELLARAQWELERSGDQPAEVVDALVRAFNAVDRGPYYKL
jgi:hypothetical protein